MKIQHFWSKNKINVGDSAPYHWGSDREMKGRSRKGRKSPWRWRLATIWPHLQKINIRLESVAKKQKKQWLCLHANSSLPSWQSLIPFWTATEGMHLPSLQRQLFSFSQLRQSPSWNWGKVQTVPWLEFRHWTYRCPYQEWQPSLGKRLQPSTEI